MITMTFILPCEEDICISDSSQLTQKVEQSHFELKLSGFRHFTLHPYAVLLPGVSEAYCFLKEKTNHTVSMQLIPSSPLTKFSVTLTSLPRFLVNVPKDRNI
jgi:hypothetical protein